MSRLAAGHAKEAHVKRARSPAALHHHGPHARDRRGPAGQQRPSRCAHGTRAGRRGRSSPRHLRHAPGRPAVAGPRPLRAVGRARVDAALRAAAPDRLRPADRRAQALPPARRRRPRATPSAATRRGSRSRPGRWARASPTPSASRWPSGCSAARFNRPGHEIVDHRTWFICSDGDLMEGISHEAASLAGYLGLEKLDRRSTTTTTSASTGRPACRFGEDVPAALRRLRLAGAADGGRQRPGRDRRGAGARRGARRPADADRLPHPHRLRLARTSRTARGAHGSPLGAEEVAAHQAGATAGPRTPQFLVPDEVAAWARRDGRRAAQRSRRSGRRASPPTREAHPERGRRVRARRSPAAARRLGCRRCPASRPGESRSRPAPSAGEGHQRLRRQPCPSSCRARPTSSTSTEHDAQGRRASSTRGDFAGRNIYYGVREHAMGAITNGLAAHGGLRPVASTFFTFSDYMKNTIRLAALMELPVDLRLHPRLGRPRRGRTDAPADRAPRRRCGRSRTS